MTDDQSMPYDLGAYVRKLDDSRRRVSGLSSRLQAIHERMSQLQRGIARETFKHKQQQQNLRNQPATLNAQLADEKPKDSSSND